MASSKGGATSPAVLRASEMEKMSIEQLKALKEQIDLEVNLLQDSLNNIKTATGRLEITATSLHDLSLRPQGKKMLVPLTASLYVPGTLDDADKVLVDIGTGYFVEKTMNEGKDYCERKINLLKSNFDQLIEDVAELFTFGNSSTGHLFMSQLTRIAAILKDCAAVIDGIAKFEMLKSQLATKKKTVADEAGAILQAKLRQPMPEQITQVDDSEISIFDAQKYFNESGSDPRLSKRVSPVNAKLERVSERYDFPSVPRLSSASSSVDGYGRNYRARSFHATPTASSEASWNSQAGLLSNPPGAIAVSMRNQPRNDDKRRGSGTKWLLRRKCPCSGKKSVQIEEKQSEPRTPSRISHTKGLPVDLKKQIQIPTPVENPIENSSATPDWLGRREAIPNTHRILADNNRFPSGLSHQRVVASTRPFSTDTTAGFSFPILSQTPPPMKLVLPSTTYNPPLEDPPRESLEVFRPAEGPVPTKSISDLQRRQSFTVVDDDMASDASSDLFEIESFSTQTTSYAMYPNHRDSLDDAPSFNTRRLAATSGGDLYCRRSLDEPRTPSIAPTECYEPSEVSIDWSVTTAEGFDRGSVTNFSVSASEVDETAMMRGREDEKNSGGGKNRGGNGGLLMSCRCEKAVSVGPHPVKCVPAEGQRVASSTARHVGSRPAMMNKPPLARFHSARLSLPFAT
ncbi:protein PHYTOCHROME KINASE SUBSTRATE 4-like [Populus alba x Populus x berolinensis]|uniref:Protein PHYTOCHROME KINASE SUBSTRATE 4-like n=1 Tax=Populus alba x Populus x berolinensis TaxID=444605 RepID=A0AAD6QUT7_9ROSI|nr:protein PHYTOCHROME KINASE SUBSTRATE 4-like [Populus alba x Populus x berolinensis]